MANEPQLHERVADEFLCDSCGCVVWHGEKHLMWHAWLSAWFESIVEVMQGDRSGLHPDVNGPEHR